MANIFAIPVNLLMSKSRQAILVVTPKWQSKQGLLQYFERKSYRQPWQAKSKLIPIVVGANGLGWDSHFKWQQGPIKHEGDMRSPAGIFSIHSAFGFSRASTQIMMPYIHIARNTICVDDPHSHYYNKIINSMHYMHHDWRSAEPMYYIKNYQKGLVIDYNRKNIQPKSGSCIFIHIWRNEFHGTAGCTAMSQYNLLNLLDWLDKNKQPILIQLPKNMYQRLQRLWNLPIMTKFISSFDQG